MLQSSTAELSTSAKKRPAHLSHLPRIFAYFAWTALLPHAPIQSKTFVFRNAQSAQICIAESVVYRGPRRGVFRNTSIEKFSGHAVIRALKCFEKSAEPTLSSLAMSRMTCRSLSSSGRRRCSRLACVVQSACSLALALRISAHTRDHQKLF